MTSRRRVLASLLEYPTPTGTNLTTFPTRRSAAVAAALAHLVERTHARLGVLSISGLGHLGAGDWRLGGVFPVVAPASGPAEELRLGSPSGLALRTAIVGAYSQSLTSIDEPGVQAVLDFIGVAPGRPLLEPIRARYATGYSDQLGQVALLAVADAAITGTPRWVVTLTWTSGCPAWPGNLEAAFRTLSDSLDPTPPSMDSWAPDTLSLDRVELVPGLALLLL
jgi:hypothetical protein